MSTATQPVHKWKEGDRALFEHEEVKILGVDESGVTHVTDGFFSTSGWLTDRLFPVTPEGKAIAAFYHDNYLKLHSEVYSNLLNWPSLATLINKKFADTMSLQSAGYETEVISSLHSATEFFSQIKTHVDATLCVQIDGIYLFGRR